MNHEFSLNKTSLISLIAGWIVIGVLLFASGLIIGSQWLSSSAALAETTAKNAEPDLPTEPVLNEEKAPPAKPAPAKSTAPAPAKEPAATNAPEQIAQSSETRLTADEVRIIQEAATDPANDESAASEPEYVTVQVGVFLDETEASRLLKDIERKGYAPSFFSGRDAEARQWYAVRIGAYSDKQQAANAAANFTRQEKIKAIVRPLNSL